jgi:DNA invertase Pin-like site-specific DNA recombinase
MRVSTKRQDSASQEPELRRWAESDEGDSHCYRDTYTGTSMDRPGFRQLRSEGEEIAAIARATGLSRPTIYRILGEVCQGSILPADGGPASGLACVTSPM